MLNFIDFQIFLFIYFLVVNFFAIHAGRFRVAVALFCIHCVAIWKYIHVLNLLDVSPPAPSSWRTYEMGLHTLNFCLIFYLFFFFFLFPYTLLIFALFLSFDCFQKRNPKSYTQNY